MLGPLPDAKMTAGMVDCVLTKYRELTLDAMLAAFPAAGPAYLYDLAAIYPRRPGKGLRAALCLATCGTFGGDVIRAVNTAAAIELFHNAFLIHDDIQDESERRRGGPTLSAEYGIGVALNVGNATNLLSLQRLITNRRELGARLAWRLFEETELMLRHSLEGQAIEIGWIRDNAHDLVEDDYYRMCLKKTSWYTCLYPCRAGALIATGASGTATHLDRFGWYLGAAFQIQDDILNLVGDYSRYGKEISGDLWEGKRTLMLIYFLRRCTESERARVIRYLGGPRRLRNWEDVDWLYNRMKNYGCIDTAREAAARLAEAALVEAETALGDVPESDDRRFLLGLPDYVIQRDR